MLTTINVVFWTAIKLLGILGATLGIAIIILGVLLIVKIIPGQ